MWAKAGAKWVGRRAVKQGLVRPVTVECVVQPVEGFSGHVVVSLAVMPKESWWVERAVGVIVAVWVRLSRVGAAAAAAAAAVAVGAAAADAGCWLLVVDY